MVGGGEAPERSREFLESGKDRLSLQIREGEVDMIRMMKGANGQNAMLEIFDQLLLVHRSDQT